MDGHVMLTFVFIIIRDIDLGSHSTSVLLTDNVGAQRKATADQPILKGQSWTWLAVYIDIQHADCRI